MRIIEYIATPQDDGRPIARIARSRMALTQGQLGSIKWTGGLLLNGDPVHANRIVRAGQRIGLRFEDAPERTVQPEEGPVNIRYQDEDILVIDKQAPLACQCADDHPTGALENRLAHLFRDEPFVFRPLNRLDKGTSGLMLAARNAYAYAILQRQLHTPQFLREYLAVTVGRPDPPEGVIDLPIERADGPTVRREVRPDGRRAVTHYRTEATYGKHSLIRLWLETGRTHQIRVHLSHLGCPVAGDFLYGEEDPRLPRRFALHSARVAFTHPVTGEKMAFDSPLPAEIAVLMEE